MPGSRASEFFVFSKSERNGFSFVRAESFFSLSRSLYPGLLRSPARGFSSTRALIDLKFGERERGRPTTRSGGG